jgi:uncharacterized membrane protein
LAALPSSGSGREPTWETEPVRKLLITLVVLAVLLVAADFGARAFAESKTADAVQSELGLATVPDVSIEGFPFLLHAVQGQYPEVIITAGNIDNGLLPGMRAVANLSQVALPLQDAINGTADNLTAAATTVQLSVPLTSLQAAVGNNVTLSAAPSGSLAVSTSVSVAGRQIPLTGVATVTVANDTLTLGVGSLTAAGVDLTPLITAAADSLAGGLTKSFPLTGVPFTVTAADVMVSGSDVVLTADTGAVALADLKSAGQR